VPLAAVFMDKAYDSAPRREALAEAGIVDGIMHRGHARRPLTAWQRWMNTALAPIRGQVERALPPCGRCLRLGTLKRSYGWRRGRYRVLIRNGAHLHLLCTAMNLCRAERLLAWRETSTRRTTARHQSRPPSPPPGRSHASISR
jgi:IS5 family transposase